jgi:carboxyl-terminal processing protease
MTTADPTDGPEPAASAPVPAAPAPSAELTDGVSSAPTSAAPRPQPARAPGRAVFLISAILVLVLGGSSLFLAGFVLGARVASEPGTPADAAAAFKPFWDTYAAITKDYAGEPVSRKQLVDGAVKGMLEALGDPFSFYMSPSDFNNSLQGLSGQFEGIGATTTSRAKGGTEGCTPLGPDCLLTVISTIPTSPAETAGLLPGDVIRAVDGTTVDGQTSDDALKKIRGPKDTVVTLTIVRGAAAPRPVAITRAVIVQPEVVARELASGRVGYIAVTGFSDNATAQFRAALKKDVDSGKKAIVLDLRGNLGGYVTAARAIASEFIASGPIYWEKGPTGDPVPSEALAGGLATDPTIKLAVLIDKNSASASEIVAGALQDTKRGVLVGQQSYGKGTVQEFLPLDDDNGGFRLTIARWLTPNQRWIHTLGLSPDVPVPLPAAGAPAPAPGTDPVLDRALQELGFGGAAVVDWRVAA